MVPKWQKLIFQSKTANILKTTQSIIKKIPGIEFQIPISTSNTITAYLVHKQMEIYIFFNSAHKGPLQLLQYHGNSVQREGHQLDHYCTDRRKPLKWPQRKNSNLAPNQNNLICMQQVQNVLLPGYEIK